MESLSNCEADSILNGLKSDIRLDGRHNYEMRKISIKLNRQNGQSMSEVCIGSTKVIAVTSCSIVTPSPNKPYCGIFKLVIDYSPLSCISYQFNKKQEEAITINKTLDNCLKESNAIDLESLCIIPGDKSFKVDCVVKVIDHLGNLFDACCLAIISSLKHFRRPEVNICGKEYKIIPIDEKEPIPLTIHHIPISISFALFNDGEDVLIDPTDREESAMISPITFILNSHSELCGIHKKGGCPLSTDKIMNLASTASNEVRNISKYLNDVLEESQKQALDDIIDRNRPSYSTDGLIIQ